MSVRAGIACALFVATAGCAGSDVIWYGHTADRVHRVEVRSEEGSQWVTVGDRATAKYSVVAPQSVTFGPRGRWAFAAARRDASRIVHWYVVSDRGESRPWHGVAEIRFTPAGKLV